MLQERAQAAAVELEQEMEEEEGVRFKVGGARVQGRCDADEGRASAR